MAGMWQLVMATARRLVLFCAVQKLPAKVEGMHEVPLDVCGADSQGAIGYALQQNLQNELKKRGIDKRRLPLW